MVSLKSAFPLAAVHFRRVQLFYTDCVRSKTWGDLVSLSEEAKADIKWWATHCTFPLDPAKVKGSRPDITIHTDASLTGWGICCSDGKVASGVWSSAEVDCHINYLELCAIRNSLALVLEYRQNCHIHIITGNSTAMFYVNKIGRHPVFKNVLPVIKNLGNVHSEQHLAICLSYCRFSK